MASKHPWLNRTALVAALLCCAVSAQAQDKNAREREALRRAQQALRTAQEAAATLERDKTQLASEKDALAQEKDRLSTDAKRANARVDGALAQARAAQAKAQALETDLSAVQQELAALKEAHQVQSQKLADAQRTVAATRGLLERSVQAQRILEARNKQLYDTGVAVVEVYRSRSPAEALARQEPFFGIGRVTLDNIAEKWLDRLESARYLDQDKLAP